MHTRTKKTIIAALMASLACVATMIIKIPSPLHGYVNLGDAIVLLCGWVLSPAYGFFAAALGSALADLLSGYVAYAPATFAIKGVMTLCAFAFLKFQKKLGKLPSQIVGGICAEIFMILGYYLFEGVLYGFLPSLVNIPANAVQGAAGVLVGLLLVKIFEKANVSVD